MSQDNEKFISTSVNGTKSYTSKLKVQNYQLNWTIEDFELICKTVKSIESPKFQTESLTNCEWFLELEPTELTENNTDEFKIRIKKTNNDKVYIDAVVSFFDYHLEVQTLKTKCFLVIHGLYWHFKASEFRNKFGKAIPKNVLIKCKLCAYESITTVEEEPLVKPKKCNDPMKNVPNLLSNENFKDVTFKLEDKEFTAHKAILAIQSPVFAAMFNSKMSEEQTSIVEINDVKPKIFQQMLNFAYNVEINDLDNKALELFYVAEKYQLEELKTNCINSLHKNLSAETVIKTLEMADFYSLSELKFECLKLLTTEWEVISETNEFETLIQNQPYLTVEVVNIRKKLDKKENAESNKSLNLPFAFRD